MKFKHRNQNRITMRTIDETKDILEKLFEKWIEPLGLKWWNITLSWISDPLSVINEFGGNPNGTVLARTYVNWEYISAKITINLIDMNEEEESKLESYVVHELMHILINEMREESHKHEERVATSLQKAFMWVREYGEREGANELRTDQTQL